MFTPLHFHVRPLLKQFLLYMGHIYVASDEGDIRTTEARSVSVYWRMSWKQQSELPVSWLTIDPRAPEHFSPHSQVSLKQSLQAGLLKNCVGPTTRLSVQHIVPWVPAVGGASVHYLHNPLTGLVPVTGYRTVQSQRIFWCKTFLVTGLKFQKGVIPEC